MKKAKKVKIKSNRGAKKRFKVTGKGRIKHRRANRNHILTKKGQKRKLQLRGVTGVNESDVSAVQRMLCEFN